LSRLLVVIKVQKLSSLRRLFKDYIRKLADLNKIPKKMILLVQYFAKIPLCCEVMSSFAIYLLLSFW